MLKFVASSERERCKSQNEIISTVEDFVNVIKSRERNYTLYKTNILWKRNEIWQDSGELMAGWLLEAY
jgi:hypothetical protein